MIVRVVESKRTTAVTTSCASRAFASVSPTCAYSGSVKLPVGVDRLPDGHRRPAHRVRRRHEALLEGRGDEEQAADDVSRGEDVGRGGPQVGVDLHEARGRRSRRLPPRGSAPPVLASQPTATTASAASAFSGAAFRVKFIRTPDGVFSKESIRSRFSCTATPDARNASATAAETSASSVGRMRGPLWKSCTREPNALKIEAT